MTVRLVTSIVRLGVQSHVQIIVSDILEALSEMFDVAWVSEYDPGFGRLASKY
jgi:hypothetical protein